MERSEFAGFISVVASVVILHSVPCVLLGYSLANNAWWFTAFVAGTACIMSCFSFVIALIFVVNLGGKNG